MRLFLRAAVAAGLLFAVSFTVARPDPAPAEMPRTGVIEGVVTDSETGAVLPGATVRILEANLSATANVGGFFRIEDVPAGTHRVEASVAGHESAVKEGVRVADGETVTVHLELKAAERNGVVTGEAEVGVARMPDMAPPPGQPQTFSISGGAAHRMADPGLRGRYAPPIDREQYAPIEETGFRRVVDAPLSTFSIDVDAASYANVRRFITDGRLPVRDAVRLEEMINYFNYDLPDPEAGEPFSVTTEMAEAPWNPAHRLALVGLQAERIETADLPPINLVFLVDVSGSMQSPGKLALLKTSLRMLANEMRPQDHVALVAYAGAAGVVLEPTSGENTDEILSALDRLEAGGSTAGGAGLRLAYALAQEHFDPEAVNRVLLATDGDFNVGPSSDAEMQHLVEAQRESGVMLSVLGFGTGNLQDAKMETMAQHGNGSYHYIDSVQEGRRALVEQMGGTLVALAKDVKIQVEFNPAHVAGYRLLGYENRRLANEDFENDEKDAGEIGAGHSVIALYEIVPVGAETDIPGVPDLRYQEQRITEDARNAPEWLTVALRYKPATGAGTFAEESVLREQAVEGIGRALRDGSETLRWASAVAEVGMLLRASEYRAESSFEAALDRARSARGEDADGTRAEFIRLAEAARGLVMARDALAAEQASAAVAED